MTGVQDSAIGLRFDEVVYRFQTGLPKRYKPADKAGTLCAVALEIEGGQSCKYRAASVGQRTLSPDSFQLSLCGVHYTVNEVS